MIVLTFHAIDQFRSRITPHLTFAEARDVLQSSIGRAVLLSQKSILGNDQYLIERPYRVVLVCKNDPTVGTVAVTSIHERWQGPTAEDLSELAAAIDRDAGRVVPSATVDASEREAKKNRIAADHKARAAEQARAAREATAQRALSKRDESIEMALRTQLAQVSASFDAKRIKLDAHVANTERNDRHTKNVLRGVLRLIAAHRESSALASEVCQFVDETAPGMLSVEFLGPRK